MSTMDGRTALLNILADEGVQYIFGNPGTTELPLMDALPEHPQLTYVMGLQEIVAMGMAEAYSRASGRLSMVNLHVAPGLGNAMGMLYTARISGAPVLVTAGQHDQGFGLTEPLLYDPLDPIAEPFVKWSTTLTRVQDVPRVIRRACKLALTPPTGPVFVGLPRDVMMAQADLNLGARTRIDAAVRPTDGALAELAELLLRAKSPVILAGHEVSVEDAIDEVAAVAELLGAAVYHQTVPHSSQFYSDHPLYMGGLARDQKFIRAVLDRNDLLFSLGADLFTLSLPSPVEPIPPGYTVVQLGQRDWEIGKNFPATLALRASIKPTLAALAAVLKKKRSAAQQSAAQQRSRQIEPINWTAQRKTERSKVDQESRREPITAEYLMMAISEAIPDDAVIAEEGVTSTRSLHKFMSVRDSKRSYGLPSGGLGWAMPGAIGAHLALPQRPMLAIVGDGAAMYSVQSLYTAAQHNLPITYVICNNHSYRILKQRLYLYNGPAKTKERFIGMDFQGPQLNWGAVAESYGMTAQRVTQHAEITPAIKRGLALKRPNLIDVELFDGFKD
ncbi:MAG: thiamine pyrophosphate-binding protein [Candidatus Lambdaproteobacteria bacterium]|nr:thiamine pyrophosphate-binding protein [Candidatus Lambdaproteobacteria bacterium]